MQPTEIIEGAWSVDAPTPRSPHATELFDLVADAGSFLSWDAPPVSTPLSAQYDLELARARARSGVDEAILTGEGRIKGRRVAMVASEFSFLGGSIGIAAAERLVLAIERATAERLPLLASPASGGTRMQEGTLAFLSMVKITAAITKHKSEGLPYLVYLRNPTTGGVMASWASLGHVTVAEPGAMLGFLGPRVYEAIHGEPFPDGVQRAENLLRRGLIDGILAPRELRQMVDRILQLIQSPHVADDFERIAQPTIREVTTWESIERSRRAGRPGVRALLHVAASEVLPLSGTGEGEKEASVILALVRIGGEACVVVGQDRGAQRSLGPLGPGALREARRGMRLASELGLPLVTVIDTPGAALSRSAEEGGLSGEIARCLSELISLPTPTLSVILGEGTGGGALALFPADFTIAAQHAWLSPLPPEGASAIIYKDTAHAAEMANAQGVSSADLHRNGIVDLIVAEQPDAAEEPSDFCRRVGQAISHSLIALQKQPVPLRFAVRQERYRSLGQGRK